MITKPTCLILGAGSSIPYGYPSGKSLKDEILKNLKDKDLRNIFTWRYMLSLISFRDQKFIDRFYESFYYSDSPSIDSFLEFQTDFLDLGKACIALSLIPKEIPSIFFQPGEGGWYSYLFNCLKTKPENFKENKLKIITFNYDRSLEYYLFTAISNTYHLPPAEQLSLFNSIPIIHVHGMLGLLPWQSRTSSREYGFNLEFLPTNALDASKRILVIPERSDSSKEFELAFEKLKDSSEIFALGFGYHEQNIKRLRLTDLKSSEIFGTAYKLGAAQRESIHRQWPFIKTSPGNLNIDAFFKEIKTLT